MDYNILQTPQAVRVAAYSDDFQNPPKGVLKVCLSFGWGGGGEGEDRMSLEIGVSSL